METVNTRLSSFFTACEALQKELIEFNIEIDLCSTEAKRRASQLGEQLWHATERINNEANRLSKISYSSSGSKEISAKDLWSFLKEHQFKFSEDLFSVVEEGHYFSVYDERFHATYRCPYYYKNTSYTIGDLHLYSWKELVDRAAIYVEKLEAALREAVTSPVGAVVDLRPIGPHSFVEIFSPKKLVGIMHPHFFASIQDKMGRPHVIISSKVTDIISRDDLSSSFKRPTDPSDNTDI